jgi:hypothetical protein
VRIELPSLNIHVTAPAERRTATPTAQVAVHNGDEVLGHVALLDTAPPPDAREILELAALATVTAVTLRDAHVTQRRATAELFDDIAAGTPDVIARAQRLGADLTHGAAALAARPATDRVLALITQELPGSLVAVRANRVEALIPANRDPLPLATRLNAGLSPIEHDFAHALRFAALALELEQTPRELRTGSWRLLLASDPQYLQRLIDDTVGNAGDLTDTLRAYIANGASVSATAQAIFAHRHTISNRLERLKQLTGHDPQTAHGLTQLALGLQALDVQRAANPAAQRAAAGPPAAPTTDRTRSTR